jgi:hypothetical protein
LDVLLEACEGPLSGTVLNMIRTILPGTRSSCPTTHICFRLGTGIWNFIFDLLSCPHVAIKLRAIHFLGLSLSGQHGEIDSRQVLQFEKIHGFASLASRLSDYSGDTEALTEGLFSLFFWRRAVRVGVSDSGGVSSTQNSLFGLDVIDEVESLAGTSEPQRSRQNTIDYENQRMIGDAVALALSESDLQSPPSAEDQGDVQEEPQTGEIMLLVCQTNIDTNKSEGLLDESDPTVPSNNTLIDPLQSPPQNNSGGGFLSLFSWIGKSEGNLDGRLSNEDSRPEITRRETGETVGVAEKSKGNTSDQKFGSKMGKLRVRAEVIVLPQILQSILSVLQNENSSERVSFAMNAIESSLTPLTVCNGSGHDTIDQESFERCARNAEVLCGQKEWLLWMCDCLLCYQRRFSQGNLHDATSSGTLEYESASGLESGDESCDGSSHHPSRNTNRILSPVPGHSSSCHITTLDKFNDPLLNTIQAALVFDIPQKPNTTRKIFDIFRLPVPEARDIQLLVLFDIVELFEKQSLSIAMEPQTLNLMRNMSTLLDQVLEKSEITLEFCVRAIHAMNSLIYHAPQDMRLKIKDTLLFDVKHAYVMRCLVDRQEDIWERVSCLSSIHSSIIDLISTGIPNRTLQDHYLFVLFLDIFLQACGDPVFDPQTSTTTESDEQTRENEGTRARLNSVVTLSEENLNLQLAALVLIQNCVQTSSECRRSVEKVLQSDFSDEQREIIDEAFCNTYGSRRCHTPVNDDEQHATSSLSAGGMTPNQSFNASQKPSGSWWSSWSSSIPDNSNTPPSATNIANGSVSLSSSENSIGQHLLGGDELQEEKHLVTDIEIGRLTQDVDLRDELTVDKLHLADQRPEDLTSFLHWLNRNGNRECIDILTKKVAKLLPALYQKTDKIQVSLCTVLGLLHLLLLCLESNLTVGEDCSTKISPCSAGARAPWQRPQLVK